MQTTSEHASQAISAEQRFKELGIHLPVPPETFGTHSEVDAGAPTTASGALGQVRSVV
jgi:hypothetical protein